jgi:hypothetical protein
MAVFAMLMMWMIMMMIYKYRPQLLVNCNDKAKNGESVLPLTDTFSWAGA